MTTEKLVKIKSGYKIEVKITGDLDNPVILLCNGSMFNYRQFELTLIPKLRKHLKIDHAIVQYNYVGYGKSSHLEGKFNFVDIAERTVELLDALNLSRVHIFGLSKGSIIGHLITARYPERVISLAGYGNPNLANQESNDRAKEDFGRRLEHVKALSGIYNEPINDRNYEIVYDTVYVPSTFDKNVFELNLIEKITNWWLKRKLKPMLMGTKVEIMDKLFSYYLDDPTEEERQRYVEAIRSIDRPVLLIHGTEDDTVPLSSSELLAEWIETAKLEIIDGYKHSKPTFLPWQGSKIMKIYAEFIEMLESVA